MSSSGQRKAVFPTRMALTSLKVKEKGARQGYQLLKKKSDALMLKLRGILQDIKQVRYYARVCIFMCVCVYARYLPLFFHVFWQTRLPPPFADEARSGKGDAGRHLLH